MKFFKILLFLILGLFPFGQLTKLPLGIPEVNIYLQDIAIFLLGSSWVFYHILKKKAFPKTLLTKPIIYFFLAAAISIIYNLPRLEMKEAVVASLYLLRWIFYAGIYFVVSDYYETVLRGNTKRFRMGLIYTGVTAAILGLFQYFLYPDLGNLAYLGWDPHKYRVFGTFFDPSFLGMILVLTIILIIDCLIEAADYEFSHPALSLVKLKSPALARNYMIRNVQAVSAGLSKIVTRRLPILYTLYFILCYIALALTYSRSSYLAWIAGIGVIAWIKKAPKFFLMAFLLGILTILLLPRPSGSEGVKLEREESVWGRVRNWKQSITIAKDKPIFGVGFNTYRYAQKQYGFLSEEDWQKSHAGAGADSSLLFVLGTTGIIGLIVYLWLWWKIIFSSFQSPASSSNLKVNLAILSSSIALLVHSWFLNSLFYPWIMVWMWILIATKERN